MRLAVWAVDWWLCQPARAVWNSVNGKLAGKFCGKVKTTPVPGKEGLRMVGKHGVRSGVRIRIVRLKMGCQLQAGNQATCYGSRGARNPEMREIGT
jgi:hypothetical protein